MVNLINPMNSVANSFLKKAQNSMRVSGNEIATGGKSPSKNVKNYIIGSSVSDNVKYLRCLA